LRIFAHETGRKSYRASLANAWRRKIDAAREKNQRRRRIKAENGGAGGAGARARPDVISYSSVSYLFDNH